MEYKFLSEKRWWIAGAVIFFLSTVLLYSASAPVLNSPDEASAYAAMSSFWEGRTWYKEAADVTLPGVKELIYPRSMYVLGDRIVLRGFWGMSVLYGILSWPFAQVGLSGVVFALTPLFALAGLWGLYWSADRFFGRRVAQLSVILLAIHPAFWYYTSRGLFHNVLFCSLLLMAAGILSRRTKVWSVPVATSLVVGALMVRPSEIWWVAALVAFWLYKGYGSLSKKSVQASALILVLAAAAYYGINDLIYSGAGALSAYADGAASFESGSALKWLLPFGVHPRVMWWSVSQWYIMFLAPFTFMALVGVAQLWSHKQTRPWLLAFMGVTLWLFVFYGSWMIHDNPSKEVTIGSAYLRYWLPSFILSSPFMAQSILTFIHSFKKHRLLIGAAVLLVLGGFSCQKAVLDTDGVAHTYEATKAGQAITEALHRHDGGIADNAVIISDHQDKYLLNDWQVMQPVKNDDILSAVHDLVAGGVPVYLVTHPRHIAEWRDLKDNWFSRAGLMYTYWFSVEDFYEIHAIRVR